MAPLVGSLSTDEVGREVVTYPPGETVGSRRPWTARTHSDLALVQVAGWLRRFHEAVLDFDPAMRRTARSGDVTCQRMLDHSVDLRLVRALEGLDEV